MSIIKKILVIVLISTIPSVAMAQASKNSNVAMKKLLVNSLVLTVKEADSSKFNGAIWAYSFKLSPFDRLFGDCSLVHDYNGKYVIISPGGKQAYYITSKGLSVVPCSHITLDTDEWDEVREYEYNNIPVGYIYGIDADGNINVIVFGKGENTGTSCTGVLFVSRKAPKRGSFC